MSEAKATKQQKLQNYVDGVMSDHETMAAAASAVAVDHIAKTQAFFAELAASLTPPHIDDRYKKAIQELLLRAEERGLYRPESK